MPQALPAALVLLAFAPTLLEWASYTSSVGRIGYTLLIPVLAGVLALQRLRERPLRSGAGDWRLAAPLLAAAALLLLFGSLGGLFTLAIAGFPLAVAGWIALGYGAAGLRRLSAPLILGLAMVPPPLVLLDPVNPLLVEASGGAAVLMLTPFDSEVSWVGSDLGFREWSLTVAEACSGSGTLLTLAALSAFFAGVFRLRPGVTVLAVALTIPFAVFVNGLRIALTALILDWFGPSAVIGTGHELLGQLVVIAGAALAAWVLGRMRKEAPAAEVAA